MGIKEVNGSSSLFESHAFKTMLIVAVLLVLSGISFMASVKTYMTDAAVTVAGLITLIVLVDAFKRLGGGGGVAEI